MNRALAIALLAVLLGPGLALAQSFEIRGPATRQIAVFDRPAVEADTYAVTGNVAYEGVAGDAYLEMWSEFPDGGRYFSRTLGADGPMGRLSGTSETRAFALPFFLTPDAPRPVRLVVNVVLPSAGRVVVRDLRFASGADAGAALGAWWSPRTGGWIGGTIGSAVGVLGALIGTLCALGRARRFAIGGLVALAVIGGALLLVGGVALASRQPFEVWYPPLLPGVIATPLALALIPIARRRFETLAPLPSR
jgi:hypothetical protein